VRPSSQLFRPHPSLTTLCIPLRTQGEALRRISEGASFIRSKGEAGTGNVVE
jgi:pyridoxal 5'-phosphate synthase pdxS subunit